MNLPYFWRDLWLKVKDKIMLENIGKVNFAKYETFNTKNVCINKGTKTHLLVLTVQWCDSGRASFLSIELLFFGPPLENKMCVVCLFAPDKVPTQKIFLIRKVKLMQNWCKPAAWWPKVGTLLTIGRQNLSFLVPHKQNDILKLPKPRLLSGISLSKEWRHCLFILAEDGASCKCCAKLAPCVSAEIQKWPHAVLMGS